jgi:hypothetical protein
MQQPPLGRELLKTALRGGLFWSSEGTLWIDDDFFGDFVGHFGGGHR